jgi:hypothetical protein
MNAALSIELKTKHSGVLGLEVLSHPETGKSVKFKLGQIDFYLDKTEIVALMNSLNIMLVEPQA